jgi:anti-sigma B factor antagonist
MSDPAIGALFSLAIVPFDDVTLVKCRGKLVASARDILYDRVSPLIPHNQRVVLDLTDLTDMDSMGLSTMVRLYISAKSAGCDFELINLGKRIRQLLGVTNLLSVFESVCEKNIKIL